MSFNKTDETRKSNISLVFNSFIARLVEKDERQVSLAYTPTQIAWVKT